MLPGRSLNHSADVEHHDHLLTIHMVRVAEVLEHLALGTGQRPVTVLGLAVATLARVAGDGQDRNVRHLLHLVDE